MKRSTLSISSSVVLGLGLAAAALFGSTGCQPKEETAALIQDDGQLNFETLKAGMPLAKVQRLCAVPPCRLVAVGETANAADEPVPGAYYFADVCPDCGGIREVVCTLYFDKSDRLLRWHEGRIEDDPFKVGKLASWQQGDATESP